MPHEEKLAELKAKSFKDLVSIIKRNTKSTQSQAEAKARDAITEKGTGSFFVDIGSHLLPTSIRKAIGDKAKVAKAKLADVDMKLGEKAHSALKSGKGGKRDALSNALFITKKQVGVGNTKKGQPKKLIEVETPGLLNPYQKAKSVGLPFAGALAITSKLSKDPAKKNGGDDLSRKIDKIQEQQYDLIEKISSLYNIQTEKDNNNNVDMSKFTNIIKTASAALKQAAIEQKKLVYENEKLAEENQKLKSQEELREKTERATKLANLMNEKLLIKKADIANQIKKIVDLDDSGYEMLKSAVENSKLSSPDKEDGIDSLAFLENAKNEKPRTLHEAIIEK